ncbi:hypothetical protein ACYSNW_04735 [Enterococcus sp. LJL99]
MKLSIRKKNNATGNAMTSNNYDIFIDGEEVKGKGILGFELVMTANELPKLTINYRVSELEIEDLEVKSNH